MDDKAYSFNQENPKILGKISMNYRMKQWRDSTC